MIIGIGTDIVEISRIEKLIEKETAVKRLLTDKEQELFLSQPKKAQWMAGRFAAKEAASKALKAGIARCAPNEVEILYDENGAPTLEFLGKAKDLLNCSYYKAHISITHDGGLAQAFVVLEETEKQAEIRDEESAKEIASLLPERDENAHKGDMGKVAVLAGSKRFSGAGFLCTQGALKGGAGLVTWCLNYKPVATPAEAMTYRLENRHPFRALAEFAKGMDAMVIGPGLGVDFAQRTAEKLINKLTCSVILDADMLTAISQSEVSLMLPEDTVITPHIGEAARLLGKSIDFIKNNTEVCAKELSEKLNVVTVLKCHNTVVCAPDGRIFVNSTGNPGMATGGSGDVLAGLIGALVKRLDIYDAARYAVYLHGLAGDIAKLKYGENSLTAKDITECIPDAFRMLEKYR